MSISIQQYNELWRDNNELQKVAEIYKQQKGYNEKTIIQYNYKIEIPSYLFENSPYPLENSSYPLKNSV